MKTIVTYFMLPLLALFAAIPGTSLAANEKKSAETVNGTVETLIIARGTVEMSLDLDKLNGTKSGGLTPIHFQAAPNSFFPIMVFNDELRGATPGTISLATKDSPSLPAQLNASLHRLVLEKTDWQEANDLMIRDGNPGFAFFKIEGHAYGYDAKSKTMQITGGRLRVTDEFAKNLGRPEMANAVVGSISLNADLRPVQVEKVVNNEVHSATMPGGVIQPEAGTNAGPDVIVGDLPSIVVAGTNTNFVGLGIGTTSCNAGVVDLNWFALPSNDHPTIPQNMYRMSGGASNNERFEQIGQSWVKHAFTALTQNICGFGCNGVGGTHLGSGCSDPYEASLNAQQTRLGSRAWINPFTGVFPGSSGSPYPANNHTGHNDSQSAPTHRCLIAKSDLSTASNPGATYFAEGQYVTLHEYVWCQGHPGQCNMYNNVSYRQFTVSGTTSFSFSPAAATVRTKPAIAAWTGATLVPIEPDPGVDGIGTVAYKVTNTSPGVWHYEYAVYNQNLDRAIQSFSVPLGCGVTASNLGFHMPPVEAGSANDGTTGSAGFSSTPWTPAATASEVTWSSETFAQNPNANAIRWGTLYNFRFDSDRPPQTATATVGFYKTGQPITVSVQAPTPDTCSPLSIASAVSRKTQGSAGTFDIPLPLSGDPGVECRSGGVNGDHTIVLTFSNTIVAGNAQVTSGTGSVVGTPTFDKDSMIVNLTGVPAAQRLTLTFSGVTDSTAQTLPDTTVVMDALMGDAVATDSVGAADIGMVKSQAGVDVTSANFRADVTGNGSISAADVSAVKSMSGATLP